MEAEGKLLLSQTLISPSSFSLLRLRRPLLRSISQAQAVERGAQRWLAAQPVFVEAAVAGAGAAVQGGLLAGSVSYLSGEGDEFDLSDLWNFGSFGAKGKKGNGNQVSLNGPIAQARNFAVMSGVNASVSCTMKRIRGKDDLHGRMIAGFGSGAVFSIVSGIGAESRSKQTAFAFSSGLLFAFLQAGLFQLGQAISPGKKYLHFS